MGGAGMTGGKGGGGRKMAAAAATVAAALMAAAAAAATTTAGGGGSGPRQRLTSTACFLAWLLAAALCSFQVSAVEVYTPAELLVGNGTEAKLHCTFTSTEVIKSAASVTWSFQAEGSSVSVTFFYYSNGKGYPATTTQFKDRSSWAGDLNKKDASIAIANMQFQDSGTYICDVKNPPDIVVTPGEINLRVVDEGPPQHQLEHPIGVLPGNQELYQMFLNLQRSVSDTLLAMENRIKQVEIAMVRMEAMLPREDRATGGSRGTAGGKGQGQPHN